MKRFLAAAALLVSFACSTSTPPGIEPAEPPAPADAAPDAVEPVIGVYRVTATSLNVRSEPAATAPVLAKLPKNARVDVLRREKTWTKVRTAEATGWVASKFLKNTESCPADAEFRFLEPPVPSFPESGVKGTVVVEVTVSAAGEVTKTEVVRNTTGDSALGQTIEAEIRKAKFLPPVRKCKPRSFIYAYTRNF